MPLRLPPLAALRIFEAAARLHSFKRAAEELGLTPSAVSHGVVALEAWLDAELFERGRRKVSLTPAGQNLLPYVGEGLAMIALGAERVGSFSRRVAISAAPSFAARWLLPRLARFRARHPEIALSIDTERRHALFPLDGVDLAIRMGTGPWPGTMSELLMRETLVPVGAPDYVQRIGRLDHDPDWRGITLLCVSTVQHDWNSWLGGAGLERPAAASALHFDTVQLALDAAATGLGLAIGRKPLVAADLAAGRVAPASAIEIEIETGYWLATPLGDEPRRELRAVRHWILAEAGLAA